jgi:heptosyltransferase I
MTLLSDFVIFFTNLMPRDYPTAPESICVLRLSAIGDCCHTLPVVRTLQNAFPTTRITWVIGKTERLLLDGADGIEFITFDKSGGLNSWRTLRRQLSGRNFPVLLNMNASMRANMVSTAIPAQRRIGFDKARARDFQWAFCNEQIAPMQPNRRHVLDGLFQFAEHLGISERTMCWDIPVSDADRRFARDVVTAEGPRVVISPCSSQRARNFRNWSADNYAALIKNLQEQHGAQVILTGANTAIEKQYEREILDRSGATVTSLIGRTSLKELFAVIDDASLVICPDSGPAHMATAAATPIVGLYATSNPERTGPYIDRDLTVNRYPEAIRAEFGKEVNEVRYGQRVRDPGAMELISVDDVTGKVAAILGQ